MLATLDHVFICCAEGAPEAEALRKLGLVEGSGNRHAGQGTANRRFFFSNAYLELLWVDDATEARGPESKGTRLWERWSQRKLGVCPFGILFRTEEKTLPFDTWSYEPRYLASGDSIQFAREVPLTEPELAFLKVKKPRAPLKEPTDHQLPIRTVSQVTVRLPSSAALSKPALSVQDRGLITYAEGEAFELELAFFSDSPIALRLAPAIPLALRAGPNGVV
jgi:hypothetical protein